MFTKIEIGTFTTTEPTTVTRTYETAAWSMEITAPAGVWPVFAWVRWSDGRPRIHSIGAMLTGPITGGFMRARMGGTFFGECEITRRKGQIESEAKSLPTWFEIEGDDLAGVKWPEGFAPDLSKLALAYTFESGGKKLAVVEVKPEAVRAASLAAKRAAVLAAFERDPSRARCGVSIHDNGGNYVGSFDFEPGGVVKVFGRVVCENIVDPESPLVDR